jgi:hypothetical protein
MPAGAQILITGNDMPSPGDDYIISTRSNLLGGVDPGVTGADMTWDYGDLAPEDQRTRSYVEGINSPYALNPLLTQALLSRYGKPVNFIPSQLIDLLNNVLGQNLSISGEYRFFQKDRSTALKADILGLQVGLGNTQLPLGFIYQDPEEVYRFPLSYQDSYTDSFRYELSIPDVDTLPVRGERSVTVDGWGTLIVPLDTFQVLRVRSTQTSNYDLSGINQLPIPLPFSIPVTQNEIVWLAKGKGEPIMRLQGFSLFGQGPVYNTLAFQDFDRRPVVNPKAITATEGCAPLPVKFLAQTQRADGLTWDFGDSSTSNAADPIHYYTERGQFQVKLTGTNEFGSRTAELQAPINVRKPRAAFTATPQSLSSPGTPVDFQNQSTTATPQFTAYTWAFGDGFFSTNKHPTHYYTQPGRYSVRLTVQDSNGCADTLTKRNLIDVGRPSDRPALQTGAPGLRYGPNPVQEQLTIRYGLGRPGAVRMALYNLQGQRVATLASGPRAAGQHRLRWQRPAALTDGVYLLRLRRPGADARAKLVFR